MKRAVIYLRVSTAAQADTDYDPEGFSIKAQREACARKAQELGAVVVEEYVDRGESAKSADRPGLKRLLGRLAEDKDVDVVIVHKVDRLARNRADDVKINLAIRQSGAQLVSVSENIDETPSGMLLHAIMAGVAEFYSQNLATEINKGMGQKVKAGGTPTLAPIGYLNIREVVDGREIRTIAIDPDRAPLVRLAFQLYGTGNYSLSELADELAVLGLTTRPTPKRLAKPLSVGLLSRVLHNRYYVGTVTYKGAEYQGRHQPLIDQELFDRVQAVLLAHDLSGEKHRIHDHYLKGSVVCGRCLSRLCLTNAKGRYLYFFCAKRHRDGGCDQPYVLAETVEEEVIRVYGDLRLGISEADGIRTALERALDHRQRSSARQATRLRNRLVKLDGERQKLLQAHYANAIPLDLLKSEQQRIGAEQVAARTKLAAVEGKLDHVREAVDDALVLLGDIQRSYRKAPQHLRRQYNQLFFTRLRVNADTIDGAEITEPIASLIAHAESTSEYHRESTNPTPRIPAWGSNENLLVEVMGLEPTTSCVPRKCSTS